MADTNGRSVLEINKQKWETADFPIVCETCLGDNPYVRMTRDACGAECKICERPFTTFRWKAGTTGRFKKTEVCQLCSKLKNVCQTCLLDLQYGLPTQVRDAVLGQVDAMPTTQGNKEYFLQNAQKMLEEGVNPNQHMLMAADAGGKMAVAHQTLQRLSRSQPYYERNKAHICSFWVKGECKRGEECPYRHEMPFDPNDPLAKQNFKDRYYGTNDPVAEKMMRKQSSRREVEPPADPTITTLFIGGITQTSDVTDKDLRDFYYQYGEIRKVDMKPRLNSAFVEFATRESAELAMLGSMDLSLKGTRLKVMWSRGSEKKALDPLNQAHYAPVPGLPAPLSAPQIGLPPGFAPPGMHAFAHPPHAHPHSAPPLGAAPPAGAMAPISGPPPGMPPGFRPPLMQMPPRPAAGVGLPPGIRVPAVGGVPPIGLPPGIRAIDPTKAFLAPPPPRPVAPSAPAGAPAAGPAPAVHYPSMDPTRSGARGETAN